MDKEAFKELEKELKLQPKSVWDKYDDTLREEAFKFCEGYKKFLFLAKTERESVEEILLAG